ncbi:MAG: hypothetical protein ACFN1J_03710 [Bacteroidota bacterium]
MYRPYVTPPIPYFTHIVGKNNACTARAALQTILLHVRIYLLPRRCTHVALRIYTRGLIGIYT